MNWSDATIRLIETAIDEDLGPSGDISSALLSDAHANVYAHIVPRKPGVLAGLELLPRICDCFAQRLNVAITATPWRRDATADRSAGRYRDGDEAHAGSVVVEIQGPRAAILTCERTILNFLCRMSGVATLTRQYVEIARRANPTVSVLDTRKTLPGWRELDKYAVRCGGGVNHRFGLFDAVLIKDNHLAGVSNDRLAAVLFEMLNRLGEPAPAFIEVEVDSLEQLREVCKVVGVSIALIDNFSPEQMRAAVKLRDELGLRGKLALEASGGVTIATIGEIAATGIDRISIGALTHSAPALDLGLDFVS